MVFARFCIMDAGKYGAVPRLPEIDTIYIDRARIGQIASKMFSKVAGCFLSDARSGAENQQCAARLKLPNAQCRTISAGTFVGHEKGVHMGRSEARVKIAPVCRKAWCAKCTSGCLLHRARRLWDRSQTTPHNRDRASWNCCAAKARRNLATWWQAAPHVSSMAFEELNQ